jgi:hypothetical protein
VKKILFLLICVSVSRVVAADEKSVEMTPAEIQAMEQQLETVTNPAARLFFQANIYRAKGEIEQALRTLAKLTALHAKEKEWLTRSELLTAKLYLEVGMPAAAEVTARQVEILNEGTDAAETARLFREKIKQVEGQPEREE